MSEADRAADYRERDVEAAHAVLIELGQVLGAYREQFVIVGGAVPWLLLPDARPRHVGTLDLDLDLDPEALAGGGYAALVETLERNYDGGWERLAEASRPLLSDPVARSGYDHIAGKFRNIEDFGPTTVRRFVEESAALGEMTPDQVQTDAFMQVSAFLRALGLG
ncbi:MAG: hypothetical protein AAB409_07865 [Gemmatimonadota bacterium]